MLTEPGLLGDFKGLNGWRLQSLGVSVPYAVVSFVAVALVWGLQATLGRPKFLVTPSLRGEPRPAEARRLGLTPTDVFQGRYPGGPDDPGEWSQNQ